MTDKEEIDFAFQWIDDHEDDMGFLPANFLAFAKDFIEAQNKSQKTAIPTLSNSDLSDSDFQIKIVYDWLMDENREPAQTKFTAGWERNLAKEIEFRIRELAKPNKTCKENQN